jgi:integrase
MAVIAPLHGPIDILTLNVRARVEAGYDIHTVQELLGHIGLRTTMIYTHVLNQDGKGVRSPLDVV